MLLQLNGGCWSCDGPATAVKFNPGKEYFDAIFASKAPYLKKEIVLQNMYSFKCCRVCLYFSSDYRNFMIRPIFAQNF